MGGKNFEFKLIEAVKDHQCIYNRALKSYSNKDMKEKAWRTVAGCVGAQIKQCRLRWRSLRDRFVKEVVKRANSGNGAVKEDCVWRYYHALSYLGDHVKPRSTFSNTQFEGDLNAENSPSSLTTETIDESPEPTLSAEDMFCKRLDNIMETVNNLLSVERSRNTDYLSVLDGYLLKLPEAEQDGLKCQFLVQVNTRINKR